MLKRYFIQLKNEFKGYDTKKFNKDLMAGITVSAVALPLALAFGVSSGADAAAGLITAILSGFIMSALSGASFQISGPTGAMTAILISLVAKYQMQGVFIACFMAGIILVVMGLAKFGKLVSFLPAPVITGFTSGISVIIALGQLDNFFGVSSAGENALQKLMSYSTLGFPVNIQAMCIGLAVVIIMAIYPQKWSAVFPSSLAAIIVATAAAVFMKAEVAVVGEIPKTLIGASRLDISKIDYDMVSRLIVPSFSIAALGMIESLLCGASASRMKGEKIDSDIELVSQGIGNIIIPFFGGVPSTAAIARTSVAIKSGLQTRMTGIIHAAGLLLSMFVLGPVMSKIPLSALAGVLMVTAFRMNEWESIKYLLNKRFKSAVFLFFATMISTVVFDLTIAILIGFIISIIIFVVKISDIETAHAEVDCDKLRDKGIEVKEEHREAVIVYITGPVFFTTTDKIEDTVGEVMKTYNTSTVIFSMRGVPMIDTSGIQTFLEIHDSLNKQGVAVKFASVQPKVSEMLIRAGIHELIGDENIHWSVEEALSV